MKLNLSILAFQSRPQMIDDVDELVNMQLGANVIFALGSQVLVHGIEQYGVQFDR